MGVLWVLLWIAVGLVGLVALAGILLWLMGRGLPEEHEARAVEEVDCLPEEAWSVASDLTGQTSWAKTVTRVDHIPDDTGREVYRQHMGRNSFLLEVIEKHPPRRMKVRITDDNGPFTGSWEWIIEPTGSRDCTVEIIEIGRIKGPIPRAVMHYIIGTDHYVKKHIAVFREHCEKKFAGV